jgi:hypothetical protein
MKKHAIKKLQLRKATITTLSQQNLRQMKGGAPATIIYADTCLNACVQAGEASRNYDTCAYQCMVTAIFSENMVCVQTNPCQVLTYICTINSVCPDNPTVVHPC